MSFQERDRTLGASSLQKDVSPEDQVTAIRRAMVSRAVLDPYAKVARLEPPQREQEVLEAMAQGCRTRILPMCSESRRKR